MRGPIWVHARTDMESRVVSAWVTSLANLRIKIMSEFYRSERAYFLLTGKYIAFNLFYLSFIIKLR